MRPFVNNIRGYREEIINREIIIIFIKTDLFVSIMVRIQKKQMA